MLFKNFKILDKNFEIVDAENLVTKNDRITYIGNEIPEDTHGKVIDGKGNLLMPGFYNAHAHSPMTLMRGYGEDMVLSDWLFKKIFPFEAELDTNSVYWGTMLAVAESLRFGIVSTSDMYYFCDAMARAFIDSKAKANISRSITNLERKPFDSLDSVKELKDFIKSYNSGLNYKIIPEASLHAEYTSDEQTALALAELTKKLNVGMQVHVSETKKEHEECKERHGGKTPVRYLADAGIFDTNTIAAHCVHIEEEDLSILKEKKVTVATNPVSNLKLASGLCNVLKIKDAGINVAIGTDSVASNNNLSFFEEMKTLALITHIKYMNPVGIKAVDALKMATSNGAIAQRRLDCGVIKVGNKADFISVNLKSPNMNPIHDILNNLLWSATSADIDMTVVDGEVLYKSGEYYSIDIERVNFEVSKATEKITGKLNG